MTKTEAWFNIALRPRKPEGSLGRTAQDGHLDSHTAPELWSQFIKKGFERTKNSEQNVVVFLFMLDLCTLNESLRLTLVAFLPVLCVLCVI